MSKILKSEMYQQLSATDKAVWSVLAFGADNKTQEYQVSLSRLRKEAGLTEKTLLLSLNRLIEIGMVTRARSHDWYKHVSTVYQVNYPKDLLEDLPILFTGRAAELPVNNEGRKLPVNNTGCSNLRPELPVKSTCNTYLTDTKILKNNEYHPLAVFLKDKIQQSGTSAIIKDTDLNNWANIFRLMVELDKRTESQIKEKIEAVYQDSFWSKNIRSADALRKQWNAGKLDRLNQTNTNQSSNLGFQKNAADKYSKFC